ncbi:hypothetical protein, partial [Okeania sp. SIO2B9]|uniref:hypothetical protein n=1 Tax=Okeania sp. SIO2B9 TaxID=2607782 RepID=UPI00142B6757
MIKFEGLGLKSASDNCRGSLFAYKEPSTDDLGIEYQYQSTEVINRNSTIVCEPIPVFLRRYNISGDVTFSRSLEDDPTASLEIKVPEKLADSLRLALPNGTKVNLFGLAFRTTGFSLELNPEIGFITANIELSGIHAAYGTPSRNPLDTPVEIKSDCKRDGWQSIFSIASRSGAKYRGKPISLFVPKGQSSLATITTRQLFDRAVINNQFLYYSHPEYVEARDWGKTQKHIFDTNNYYRINNKDYGGSGAFSSNQLQLGVEYSNLEARLANIEQITKTEESEITERWIYKNAKSLVDCQTPAIPISVGEQIYILKNPTAEILKNPSLAFDANSFTKTAICIKERNGTEISR